MSAPPTLVTVEVMELLWLVWDEARGRWTLQRADGLSTAQAAPILEVPRGTMLTLVWPEPAR